MDLKNTLEKLGSGGYGVVYRFISKADPSEQFAVKIEEKNCPHRPRLRHESKIYETLRGVKNYPNIWGWYEHPTGFVLVMELLGSSVQDLFQKCCCKFSVVTACLLADQFLDRIEGMHSRLLVHRDIKPSNFVIGRGDRSDIVFLVDFGLTTRYKDKRTLKHRDYSEYEWRSLVGTPRFVSINNHLGIQYSRRDDLESIAYCLIYFLRGNLPWQGLEPEAKTRNQGKEEQAPQEDRYRAVLEKKQTTSVEELCEGMPVEFQKFLVYAKNLSYEADPDYDAQRSMFHQLFEKESKTAWGSAPPRWDWVIRAEQKAAEEAEVERRKRELQQQQSAKTSAKSAAKGGGDADKTEQEEDDDDKSAVDVNQEGSMALQKAASSSNSSSSCMDVVADERAK
mmetsp:Transcript_26407/g.44586  ORF Transcript_26407/g.44586 Transcript_26407/m.44586 type:complete len:395 (-) Transcript_26407:432-1616(-)